jgi:hypothetical protein
VDELDIYLQLIESWAHRSIGELPDWIDPLRYLTQQLQNGNHEVSTAVACQEKLLTDEDMDFARPYIEGDILKGYPERRIAALLKLTSEMQGRRRQIELSRTLARYRPSEDALLLSNPTIAPALSKHREMVSVSMLQQIDRSAMFTFKEPEPQQEAATVKLTSFLNPEIVNFVRSKCPPSAALEVRLDPDYPSASADPPNATYTPPLHSNFSQVLTGVPLRKLLRLKVLTASPPMSLKQDPEAALEYFSRGLRSLQAFGSRDGDRAEIYLEELIDTSTVRLDRSGELTTDTNGIIVGRMIHCDTTAPDATPCEQVQLFHLDLAINVYAGETGSKRLATPLSTRVEATERIHLFKVAPAPLSLLPGIAWLFFSRSPRQLMRFFIDLVA